MCARLPRCGRERNCKGGGLGSDKSPFKSMEELAQIAFLDELRATDHDAQPERPLSVVVKVSSVRNVPKANEKYALAEISDGTSSWLVCLPRGLVKARQHALFVSEDAILPMDERYICGELALAHRRNIKGGVPMLTLNVRRNIYHANQGVLYPLSAFPELKKNAVGDIVSDALHLLSEKRMEAEKEARRIADEKRVAADKEARKIRIEERRRDERTQEMRENHVVLGPAPEFVQRTCLDAAGNMPELFEQYTASMGSDPIAGNYSKPDSGSCDGDAARCRERVPDDVWLRVAVGMDRQPEAVPTSSFVTTSRAR